MSNYDQLDLETPQAEKETQNETLLTTDNESFKELQINNPRNDSVESESFPSQFHFDISDSKSSNQIQIENHETNKNNSDSIDDITQIMPKNNEKKPTTNILTQTKSDDSNAYLGET